MPKKNNFDDLCIAFERFSLKTLRDLIQNTLTFSIFVRKIKTIANRANSFVTKRLRMEEDTAIFQLIHKILTLCILCLKNYINKRVIIKLK